MSYSILYFRNGIGNLIQATPAIQAISKTLGEKIDICLDSDWNHMPTVEDIILQYPFVNRVIKYPFVESVHHYKNWIYFGHNERTPAFDLFKSKSRVNCDDLKFFDKDLLSEVQYYMAIARRWGYPSEYPTPPQFVPTDGYVNMMEWATGPIVALCNGGSGYLRRVKQWCGFYELANSLLSSGYYVVLLGNNGELKDIPSSIDFTGKLSFTHTCHVLKQSNFIVTTDTAMMHAADALMLKGIALFGATSIVKNGPINGTIKVMFNDIECRPCQHKASGFNNCSKVYCMNMISAQSVYKKVLNSI